MTGNRLCEEGTLQRPTGTLWWRRVSGEDAQEVPLIVVHGGPGMPSYYLECLAALADDRPVIFYDQIGCGRSATSDPAAVNLESIVNDLLALIDHLGCARSILLGHSFGGMVIAEAYRKAQESDPGSQERACISALIFSSPLISTERWISDTQVLIRKLPAALQSSLLSPGHDADAAAGEEAFYQRFFCALDPWPEELQRTMDTIGADVYERLWGFNEFSPTGELLCADSSDVLPAIESPTLWICGTQDEVLPETLTSFAGRCPRSAVSIFDSGTHSLHLEQPEEYMRLVRSFMNGAQAF